MQSLRVHDKAFKCNGTGEKIFQLSDMILYSDYDRILYLDAKEDEDEIDRTPSLDVDRLLALSMSTAVQTDYRRLKSTHSATRRA